MDQIFNGIKLPSLDIGETEEGKTGTLKEASGEQPGNLEGNDKGQAGTMEEGDRQLGRGLQGASKDLGEEETKEEIKTEEEKGLVAAVDAFNKNIHPITPVVYERLSDWLVDVEPEVVILAIEEAANNNARSMNYVNTILNSWLAQGITSEQAARAYLRNRNSKKERNYSSKGKRTDTDNEEIRPNAAAYRVIGGEWDE